MTTEAIREICEASTDEELLTKFKMGFELETQATLGKRADDLLNELAESSEDLVDFPAYQVAVASSTAKFKALPAMEQLLNIADYWMDVFKHSIQNSEVFPRVLEAFRCSREIQSSSRFFSIMQELGISEDKLLANLARLPRQPGYGAHGDGSSSQYDWYVRSFIGECDLRSIPRVTKENFLLPEYQGLNREQLQVAQVMGRAGAELLFMATDGSVSGMEFKTYDGGVDYETFTKAAHQVFSVEHRIDTRCSFHIHVSVPGVSHRWGAKFQREATLYLIAHRDEMPEGVRQRFASMDWMRRYYCPKLSAEKYSLVAARDCTWEFRGFGNVTNPADADICVRLACLAMQHAYRVGAGLETKLYPAVADEDFTDFASRCLNGIDTPETWISPLSAPRSVPVDRRDLAAIDLGSCPSTTEGDLVFEVVGNAVVVRPSR